LNEAQVLAIIRNEVMSIKYQNITHLSPASALAGNTGVRSVGYNERLRGFTREIGLPVGTNKIYELLTNPVVCPINVINASLTAPACGFDLRCTINPPTQLGVAAGECFIGIQMGSFKCLPPFQTNYGTAPGGDEPVFQFRWNFTTQRFEVLFWDSDLVTAPDVVATDLQVAFSPDAYQKEFRMVLEATSDATRTLKCYLNGVLAHTYATARLRSEIGDLLTGPGVILCGGTSAALSDDAHFYDIHCVYPGFNGIVPANPA
jgi:hypothetical protein